jgi:hypothetical protein
MDAHRSPPSADGGPAANHGDVQGSQTRSPVAGGEILVRETPERDTTGADGGPVAPANHGGVQDSQTRSPVAAAGENEEPKTPERDTTSADGGHVASANHGDVQDSRTRSPVAAASAEATGAVGGPAAAATHGGVQDSHSLGADTDDVEIKAVPACGYGAFAKTDIDENYGQLLVYGGARVEKEDVASISGDETYLMTHGDGHVFDARDKTITARYINHSAKRANVEFRDEDALVEYLSQEHRVGIVDIHIAKVFGADGRLHTSLEAHLTVTCDFLTVLVQYTPIESPYSRALIRIAYGNGACVPGLADIFIEPLDVIEFRDIFAEGIDEVSRRHIDFLMEGD